MIGWNVTTVNGKSCFEYLETRELTDNGGYRRIQTPANTICNMPPGWTCGWSHTRYHTYHRYTVWGSV